MRSTSRWTLALILIAVGLAGCAVPEEVGEPTTGDPRPTGDTDGMGGQDSMNETPDVNDSVMGDDEPLVTETPTMEDPAVPDGEVMEGSQAVNESDGASGAMQGESLEWTQGPDSLPPGARMAVLSGDPASEGVFTLRFEVPAGYEIPPHTHAAVEHVTILSGFAHIGMGTQPDEANATRLAAGDFIAIEPGMQHFFLAGEETVVLQLHGDGPWSIEYVDPEDDPRGAPS